MDVPTSEPLDMALEGPDPERADLPWIGVPLPPPSSMKLSKDLLRVRLCMADELIVEGDLYLTHDAQQDVLHEVLHLLAELKDGFFPLQEADGAIPLVHTQAVQWIAIEQRDAEVLYGVQRQVRVVLSGGRTLVGIVELDVPTHGPRVSDLLNEFRPYLLLRNEGQHYVVNRGSILRVYDLGPP